MLSVILSSGEYGFDLRFDTILLDASTLEVVSGPHESTIPLRWLPDSTALLMHGAACGPDGGWLELLDLTTGASRRIAPDIAGFFHFDASRDATLVAAGSRGDYVVIDVATGTTEVLPRLGLSTDAPPIVFDAPRGLQFSASNRWLVADIDRGSEGC